MKILGEEEHSRPLRNNNVSNNSNYRPPQNNWNHRGPPRKNNDNNEGNRRQINQVQMERTENPELVTGEIEDNQTTHTVNNMVVNNTMVKLYVQCEIEGESIQLLIDTGATISVLTKELVEIILRKNSKIPTLPITGVQISNAIGKKICKVSRQIFCRYRIGTANIYANFIQVENLNERGIIGAEVLNQYNAQINFNNQTIKWEIEGTIHTT